MAYCRAGYCMLTEARTTSRCVQYRSNKLGDRAHICKGKCNKQKWRYCLHKPCKHYSDYFLITFQKYSQLNLNVTKFVKTSQTAQTCNLQIWNYRPKHSAYLYANLPRSDCSLCCQSLPVHTDKTHRHTRLPVLCTQLYCMGCLGPDQLSYHPHCSPVMC